MTTRRDFVKMTCGLCAALAGVGIVSTVLQSCTTIPLISATPNNGKISVDESKFTADTKYVLVRCIQLENDILLVRNPSNTKEYWALLMQCSHQHNPLTVQKQTIYCATHGSEFNLDGKATKSPAVLPLKKYLVERADGKLVIILS